MLEITPQKAFQLENAVSIHKIKFFSRIKFSLKNPSKLTQSSKITHLYLYRFP